MSVRVREIDKSLFKNYLRKSQECFETASNAWEASLFYGDVRTIGFWKHQVNVWYLTELAKTNPKIKGNRNCTGITNRLNELPEVHQ